MAQLYTVEPQLVLKTLLNYPLGEQTRPDQTKRRMLGVRGQVSSVMSYCGGGSWILLAQAERSCARSNHCLPVMPSPSVADLHHCSQVLR